MLTSRPPRLSCTKLFRRGQQDATQNLQVVELYRQKDAFILQVGRGARCMPEALAPTLQCRDHSILSHYPLACSRTSSERQGPGEKEVTRNPGRDDPYYDRKHAAESHKLRHSQSEQQP